MKKPSKHLIAEVPRSVTKVGLMIGIDLGDVWSHYCTLNEDGEVVDLGRFRTTLSSDRVVETQPYVGGVSIWPRVEASSPTIGPSLPWLASWQSCFIESGSRKSRTSRSTQ